MVTVESWAVEEMLMILPRRVTEKFNGDSRDIGCWGDGTDVT